MASTVSRPQPVAAVLSAGSEKVDYSSIKAAADSLSSSPRQFPTDLTSPILEEATESDSESPNEPRTPASSGRQSQDFTTLPTHENHDLQLTNDLPISSATSQTPFSAKPPLLINTAPTPSPRPEDGSPTPKPSSAATTPPDQEPPPTPLSRRSTRGSTSSFRRTMSNMSSMFRRSNSQSDKQAFGVDALTNAVSDTNLSGATPRNPTRRFSMHKSSSTTRSNSPPSPGSPLEMATTTKETAAVPTVPNPEDFTRKKLRASTGFSLSNRKINFANATNGKGPKRPTDRRRRASSFDGGKAMPAPHQADPRNPAVPLADRLPWGMPAEAGTGVKARRMSLNLPDDFTVDVAELLDEFEYQHKLLGRHGKHLGRGATSKVTLMTRKGCPGELYAVKEFRGKSRQETESEYEKKVKSEYSIAKSLHHPNIVETIRLCTNHGRWNHVMEYCSEGDLFSLVQKGYLKGDAKAMDRYCLFKQLLQGINYLHCNGIAHRDIKLENLLLTKDSKLKITDFGVSDVFCGSHPGLREAGGECGKNMAEVRMCEPGICGSMPYIAPEVVGKTGAYDPRRLDVWSSAIIMIYLTFGGAIWERAEKGNPHFDTLVRGWKRWNDKHQAEPECAITDADYPSVAAFDAFINPPALRRVLLQMLNPDPERRISMAEVMNNRWVRNIECCQLESYEDPTKMIDASKKNATKSGAKKIFCHSHLPPKEHKMGTLPKMPQYAGY